jgi:hypothetical protein
MGVHCFTYANFGAFQSGLATETGPWAADTVTYAYGHQVLQGVSLAQPGAGNWTASYGSDSLLRLRSVSSPVSVTPNTTIP